MNLHMVLGAVLVPFKLLLCVIDFNFVFVCLTFVLIPLCTCVTLAMGNVSCIFFRFDK